MNMKNNTLISENRGFCPSVTYRTGTLPPERRKKILKKVAVIHVSILLIPLIWFSVSSYLTPAKPAVIRVQIVSPPPSSNAAQAQPAPRSHHTPPAQKPPPQQAHRSINVTRKRNNKRPAPHKRKPAWKPRTADSITISKTVITNTKPKPNAPRQKTLTAEDIESRLRKVYKTNANTSLVTSPSGQAVPAAYRDKLFAAVYRLWKQPSKPELKGQYPIVDITLTVHADGLVGNSRISQKSGNPAMDLSAYNLLKELKKLPPPPSGEMTFTVSLEIIE